MELTTLYLDQPIVWKRVVDIAAPYGTAGPTALFYIHGGGWNSGNRDLFHYHLEHFSSRGYWCASAGYRPAPEVNWKQQLTDVTGAYLAFLRHLERRQETVRNMIVLGSSAGAHLASLLALVSPEALDIAQKDRDLWRKPDACVSINGPATLEEWPDMNADIRGSIEQTIGYPYDVLDRTDMFAQASPVNHVGRDSPSFLFLLAEREYFFPHAHIHLMSEKIRSYGGESEAVLIEGTEHGFFYRLETPEQQRALGLLEAWFDRRKEKKMK
ncbi:alpha/beta hydrolase [Paenibacillus sp. MY03]|uniref:alpha/beta hydrolase n=1 Tax=Paenibacillus sp. MY03 TaxID=302980 RepID=UPI0015C60D29|nr:alpha/beta hydrolase [Paenibacillus sp. MY03]